MDIRDGAKFTVQVVHNANMLLSMILVYGAEQRLLCMAHLIGADSLPSKEQLDSNLVNFVVNTLKKFFSVFCRIYLHQKNEYLLL